MQTDPAIRKSASSVNKGESADDASATLYFACDLRKSIVEDDGIKLVSSACETKPELLQSRTSLKYLSPL